MSITIPLACVCGDFVGSHSQPKMWSDGSMREPIKTARGICWGWCDQTCPEFRPAPMNRASSAWVAVLGKANELDMPQHFACDLYRDWQRLTAADAPQVFIWSPYQNGTDLLYGPRVLSWLNAISRTSNARQWFVWDGLTLQSDCIHAIYRRFCRAERALEPRHLIPAAPLPD